MANPDFYAPTDRARQTAYRGGVTATPGLLAIPQNSMIDPGPGRVTWTGSVPDSNLTQEFERHEKEWKEDTRYTSSLSDKYLHPSYARIIGMGFKAVPLILRSLAREPNDWFYALRAITGTNPVRTSDVGKIEAMKNAWLKWGKARGLFT